MNYEQVIDALKPLEANWVVIWADPDAVFVGEEFVEEVRYLRPEERLPETDNHDCTVILWTGERDEEGMPIGFAIPASRVDTIVHKKVTSNDPLKKHDSIVLTGSYKHKRDGREPLTIPVKLTFWIRQKPTHERTPTVNVVTARYTHNRIGYHRHLRELNHRLKKGQNERPPDYDVRHTVMVRDGYELTEVWFLKPNEAVPEGCYNPIPLDDGYRMAFRHTREEDDVHEADVELVA